MEQIEIIGYTVVNGKTHYPPRKFKSCFINSLNELDPWEEKVRKRWERKLGSECDVHSILRHIDEIYIFPKKKKNETKKYRTT